MVDPNVAVDVMPDRRPGVPKEITPPAPVPTAPREVPAQPPQVEILVERTRELTPVFGTCQPPHGVAGAIRRRAFRFPDYRVRHWLLLMLADRVDVQEARIRRLARSPLAWALAGALAIGFGAAGLRLRRR